MSWRLENYRGLYFHDIKPDIQNSFLWKQYVESDLNIFSFSSILQKHVWNNPSYINQIEYEKLVKELEDSSIFKSFIENLYSDFTLKIETDEKGNFLPNLHRDNITKVNVHYFIDNLVEVCNFLNLDLGTFITNFNKMFSYYIEDFPSEIFGISDRPGGLINFNKYFGLDINNLTLDSLTILLEKCCAYPFDSNIVSYSCYGNNKTIYPINFHFNIETLFIQFWYIYQYPQEADKRIFSDKRKFHWMDFDNLMVKKLNSETIKQMMEILLSIPNIEGCLFHLEYYGKQFTENILSTKVEKDIKGIFDQDLIKECSDFVLYLKSKITNLQPKEKQKMHAEYIVKEFNKGVEKVLEKIQYELELISMIINLNEMILDFLETNNQDIVKDIHKSIWIMTGYGKTTYNQEEIYHLTPKFSRLVFHAKCCFDQILISCHDNIKKQSYSNSISVKNNLTPSQRFLPIFKDILFDFLNNNNCSLCRDYYHCKSNNTFVYCHHETISYYSYSKWWFLYKVMIEKYYNEDITNVKWNEMVQNTFQVWYPKESYCEKCYFQYKNYEEIMFNKTKGIEPLFKLLLNKNLDRNEKIANEMLYVAFMSQVPKFRLLYTKNCDIPMKTLGNELIKINFNHSNEIKAKKEHFKNILTLFLKSLNNQVNFISTKINW